jgi:uncharacterized protein
MIPLLKTLLVAIPEGALASLLGSPLPWVIGPLVVCAGANLLGAGLACPTAALHAGQWAIPQPGNDDSRAPRRGWPSWPSTC